MTGAAWLSSARAVRRSIKLGNERNPYPVLYLSQETAQPFWHYYFFNKIICTMFILFKVF